MKTDFNWMYFQAENGAWADETFGPSLSPDSTIAHLKKEVEELVADPSNVTEYADCMILLIDAARRVGITMDLLLDHCWAKLEINIRRKWGPPDKDGIIEHIKEEGK